VDDATNATTVNRAHWDAVASVHGEGEDRYYDVDALRRGDSSLRAAETAAVLAVGDVAGKDVLHVQCHLGLDSVTLARRGARVTGLDFSPVSLAKAHEIAEQCGVDVSFVEGDSTAVPESLHGRFDVAYATIGVLCWIEDLDAWMRSVASTLRPGGRLLLVDLHPLFCMFATLEPLVADFPYAHTGAVVFDEPGTYAAPDAEVEATRTVEFAHSVGEVVTAAVRAGLRVEQLVEHLDADFDPRGSVLAHEDDGHFRLRLGGLPAPVLYTLIAQRPG
jgi:SAM-dependent methyltransferase